MMIGVAADPTYPEATLDLDLLERLGIRIVRCVSMDLQPVHDFVDQCNQRDIVVWATVAKESDGYILPGARLIGLGNEPDSSSPSSWTRTPQQYHDDWNIYWGTWFAPGKPYEGVPVIIGGLSSGSTQWLHEVWQIGPLQGCSGFDVHPYAKTALQARDLINSYKPIVGYNIPAYVSECNFAKKDILYAKSLFQNANVLVMCHYPWTNVMDNTVAGLKENPDILSLFCA